LRFSTEIAVTHVGRGRISGGQPRPHRQGKGPERSLSFLVPSIYVYTLRRRTIDFGVVTYMGRSLFLGGQLCPPSEVGLTSTDPNLGVLPYLCVHGQREQIRRGNTCGEGRVFGGSVSPLYVAQMRRAVCQR